MYARLKLKTDPTLFTTAAVDNINRNSSSKSSHDSIHRTAISSNTQQWENQELIEPLTSLTQQKLPCRNK